MVHPDLIKRWSRRGKSSEKAEKRNEKGRDTLRCTEWCNLCSAPPPHWQPAKNFGKPQQMMQAAGCWSARARYLFCSGKVTRILSQARSLFAQVHSHFCSAPAHLSNQIKSIGPFIIHPAVSSDSQLGLARCRACQAPNLHAPRSSSTTTTTTLRAPASRSSLRCPLLLQTSPPTTSTALHFLPR